MNKDIDHLLAAGHGRSYQIIKKDPEKYRHKVLELCTYDSSYDLQCEGTRAWFVYELISLYDDKKPFEGAALYSFNSEDIDDCRHPFNHLCDLLTLFEDDGSERARDAILDKYHSLHNKLMTRRFSLYLKEVCECYECIAISLISRHETEYAKMIICDIGAWFIRRRRADREDLKWSFAWLMDNMKDEFGDELDRIKEELALSKEARRFFEIMSLRDIKPIRSKKAPPDAETVEKMANEGTLKSRSDIIRAGIHRMEDKEKLLLAEKVINETDENKKAMMLSVFTHKCIPFPLGGKYLVDWYTSSQNSELRWEAFKAMEYAHDEAVCEFAVQMLSDENLKDRYRFVGILIYNFNSKYKDVLLKELEGFEIVPEGNTDWHSVCLDIVNNKDTLPESAYVWVYENSLCSCCRLNAIEILQNRNVFLPEWAEECKHDCNDDIREMFE